jgi:hypothetical protein
MMASRGMGAINPSKVPKGKTRHRKDGDEFQVYAGGGMTGPKLRNVGSAGPKLRNVGSAGNPEGLAGKYSTDLDSDLTSSKKRAEAAGATKTVNAIQSEEGFRKRLKGYKSGGSSKVNEAGNYTKPGMRKSLFESIKARAVQGTGAGQWSARKAQLLAKQYKAKGGGYRD